MHRRLGKMMSHERLDFLIFGAQVVGCSRVYRSRFGLVSMVCI